MITKKQREDAENLIYKVFDVVDKTKTNSDYYRKIFSTMTDEDFFKFCQRRRAFPRIGQRHSPAAPL